MANFTLTDFLKNLDAATKYLTPQDSSYFEVVKSLNVDAKRKRVMQEQEEAEKRRQQHQAEAERNYDAYMVSKGTADILTDLMNKYAKLGTENRDSMPQVDAKEIRKSDIPTKSIEFVDPKKLKSIQDPKDTNQTKVQGIANHWDTVGKEPVLISKDNWIIDGHHRVEAAKKKNKWVRVIRIQLPGKKALMAVKKAK